MKEKVLMLLACLWLGIGFSMAQAPKTVAGVVTSADDGDGQFGPGIFPGGAVGLCFTGQERQKQRPRQRPGALLYAQITTRAGRLLLTSGLIEGKRIQ
mgnify:CR=1 FL=1